MEVVTILDKGWRCSRLLNLTVIPYSPSFLYLSVWGGGVGSPFALCINNTKYVTLDELHYLAELEGLFLNKVSRDVTL